MKFNRKQGNRSQLNEDQGNLVAPSPRTQHVIDAFRATLTERAEFIPAKLTSRSSHCISKEIPSTRASVRLGCVNGQLFATLTVMLATKDNTGLRARHSVRRCDSIDEFWGLLAQLHRPTADCKHTRIVTEKYARRSGYRG